MPTRNVNLTDQLDRFVAAKVESGSYENASEVVRAGLRALERIEQEYETRLALLRAAIDEGEVSESCCQTLADRPALGRPCDEVRPGLRRIRHGRHVVFFRQAAKGICIVRIPHQGMMPQRHVT